MDPHSMPRPLPTLLAMIFLTLCGVGGSAGAESAPLRPPDRLEAPEDLHDAGPTLVDARLPPDAATEASDHDPDVDGWPARIEARLATLAERSVRTAADDAPVDRARHELAARLDEIARKISPRAKVGITVRDLDSGRTLYDWQGDAALNPASNHKLLTAAAAVELLGADYRFETRVLVRDDTLYLVGEGDPSLQVRDLKAIVDAVRANVDVGRIARIVIDDSFFSERRFGPGYDPDGPGYSWMAPSGALSLQFNTLEIAVSPRAPGEPADVVVRPACSHVQVRNTARTGRGRGVDVQTHARDDQTVVHVGGSLPASHPGVRLRRRVSDPGLFTGTTFASLLTATPLPVERGRVPADATLVTTHASAPLPEVLGSALKFSNNFTTEQVLRTLGRRMTGEPGDWRNGGEALRRFWNAIGQDERVLVFENASGLSRTGRLTARALVDLLQAVTTDEAEAAEIIASMPVAGREGTLRGRLKQTAGRVRAKTGTLADASALTGIVAADDGHPRLGFSIIVNGRVGAKKARRLQDRMVMALVAHMPD